MAALHTRAPRARARAPLSSFLIFLDRPPHTGKPVPPNDTSLSRQKEKTCITTPAVARATFETRYPPPALMFLRPIVLMMLASCHCGAANAGRCSSVHTSPLPMDCDPPSAPLLPTATESAHAIVGEVTRCLQKHSPSPSVHLETLGLRWQALGRNESVSNVSTKLLPAKKNAIEARSTASR